MRLFLTANAAWEGTFAAMRTFVVLYITKGLGQPLSTSSAVLATVAVGYVIAAVAAGPLGDRFGLARTILYASCVYGLGMLLAGLSGCLHGYDVDTDLYAECLRDNNNSPLCCPAGQHVDRGTCCPAGSHKAVDVEHPFWVLCIADDADAGINVEVDAGTDAETDAGADAP